jgi:hypothetical protein
MAICIVWFVVGCVEEAVFVPDFGSGQYLLFPLRNW